LRALVIRDGRLFMDPQVPRPESLPGEVLVRVRMAGICGTDLELLKGYMAFSGIPGHEFVGVVEEDGGEGLVGRRVVAEINCVCGECEYCMGSMPTHCLHRTVIGIDRHDGAFADYITVPSENVHLVPETVPDREAVMIEPLAAALKGVEDASVDSGQRLAVLGDGRLGLMVAMVADHMGIDSTMVGRHPDKMKVLEGTVVRTIQSEDSAVGGMRGAFDRVIDCTGNAGGLSMALDLVRPRGRVVVKTTVAEESCFSLASLVVNEVEMVGSRCGNFDRAIEMLSVKGAPLERMITGSFRLEEWEEAFEVAGRGDSLKVLFVM
jgi:threonine dehydrogenase-like Zn-dependent dehydrogenase